ncbi:hypothetical protein EUTSA_v10005236mg [Eutrema salsugineum]|uniref:Uncharacterized protein n=1 Tax=Eutrema salsugineum TaxID=72664 RepID=V4KIV7_EUTSA|nr:hypothetical protein EUTSA_v10005236mg [Eutrema salsugineum]
MNGIDYRRSLDHTKPVCTECSTWLNESLVTPCAVRRTRKILFFYYYCFTNYSHLPPNKKEKSKIKKAINHQR